MAMMLMSKPKKASNFLRPAEEESQTSDWLTVHIRGLITNALKAQSNKSPYLSRKRKKNVSMMVMRTPAHKGILPSQAHTDKDTQPVRYGLEPATTGSSPFLHVSPYLPADSRLKAMAQPMTSCMSDPMMASSTISHKMIRGT